MKKNVVFLLFVLGFGCCSSCIMNSSSELKNTILTKRHSWNSTRGYEGSNFVNQAFSCLLLYKFFHNPLVCIKTMRMVYVLEKNNIPFQAKFPKIVFTKNKHKRTLSENI